MNRRSVRLIWWWSFPVVLLHASETLIHLITTVFVARLGVTELGAFAIADSVVLLFLALPFGLVEGTRILIARRLGERQPAAVGAAFDEGGLLVLGAALLAGAALKLASPPIGRWLIGAPAVAVAVDDFLQVAAYGFVFSGASLTCGALLMSVGRTAVLIPATAVLAVADIVLNDMFIFGRIGAPALGMRGAALGYVGAEAITCVYLVAYVVRHFGSSPYGVFRHFLGGRPRDRSTSSAPRTLATLLRLSTPIAGLLLLDILLWLAFFLLVERTGSASLAIANIVYTCFLVFSIPMRGFGEIASSLVSRLVGRQRPHRIGSMLADAILGAVLATGPLLALALLAPHWVLATFSLEAGLVARSMQCLRIVAGAMLIVIPAHVCLAAVSGTGDTLAALAIEFLIIALMLAGVYFATTLAPSSATLVWLSIPASWGTALVVACAWMRSGKWKRVSL